jgi:hypothetical protein
MTLREIIRQLGGPSAIAAKLQLSSPSTAVKWSRRGSIPVDYWPALIAMAGEKKVRITPKDLLAAHVPDCPTDTAAVPSDISVTGTGAAA